MSDLVGSQYQSVIRGYGYGGDSSRVHCLYMDEAAVLSREHLQLTRCVANHNQLAILAQRHTRHLEVYASLELPNHLRQIEVPISDATVETQCQQLALALTIAHPENPAVDCAVGAPRRRTVHLSDLLEGLRSPYLSHVPRNDGAVDR